MSGLNKLEDRMKKNHDKEEKKEMKESEILKAQTAYDREMAMAMNASLDPYYQQDPEVYNQFTGAMREQDEEDMLLTIALRESQ